MSKRYVATLVLTACLAGPVHAQDGSLVLRLAGETAGPPVAFEVRVGETIIGTGQIDDAGPVSGGEAALRSLRDFAFDVSATALASAEPVRVTLIRVPGSESVEIDTDLYVESATLDGQKFPASSFVLENQDGIVLRKSFVVDTVAVLGAGWSIIIPAPVAGEPVAAVAADAAATVAAPAQPAAEATPAVAVEEPVEPAPAAVESAAACTVTTTIALNGFPNAGTALGEADAAQLSKLAESLAGEVCTVTVTGYASTRGDEGANLTVSAGRATAVYDALQGLDVDLSKAAQGGAGETDQFGPDQADNRRVVVDVKP